MHNITIITPNWKPMNDGLAGHSLFFAEELIENNCDVNVITTHTNKALTNDKINVATIVNEWSWSNFEALKNQLKENESKIVFFQYAPFAYSKRGGINYFIPFFAFYCRIILRLKVHILFHELYWPFELKPKSLLMHFSHKLQAIALCSFSNKVFVSNAPFSQRLKNLVFWKKKPEVLNSGSNLPTPEDSEISSFINRYQLEEFKLICLFGAFHPSKRLDLVLYSFANFSPSLFKTTKVVFIGQTKEQVKSNISESTFSKIENNLICLGSINDQAAAYSIGACHFFICPYIDGANSRRGTMMAAMKLGLTTITCKGEHFEEIFAKVPNLYILNQESKSFMSEFETLYGRLVKQNNMTKSQPMIDFYNDHFSWKNIIRKYLTSF